MMRTLHCYETSDGILGSTAAEISTLENNYCTFLRATRYQVLFFVRTKLANFITQQLPLQTDLLLYPGLRK